MTRQSKTLVIGTIIVAGVIVWSAFKSPRAKPVALATTNTAEVHSEAAPANGGDDEVPGISAEQLRRALLKTAAQLDNLRISVVERTISNQVLHKEIWMHGKSAQVLYDQRESEKGDNWWVEFKPRDRPLTSADLDSVPGLKICVDLTRKMPWADSRPLERGRFVGKSRTLHTVGSSLDWLGDIFLPLVEFDQPWALPQRAGNAPVVNALARRPATAWRVLGEETLGDIECVKAEIDQHDTTKIPLKRHPGELALTSTWLAWFSKSHGLTPVRIEQAVRYGLQGREYKLAPRADRLAIMVYEAADFVRFGDIWYPRTGRQDVYDYKQTSGGNSGESFDFDALADKLLADGILSLPGELQLTNRHEWRILAMEPIDPALNLWFDPQPGAEVVNRDTNERHVEGDLVASKRYADEAAAIKSLIGTPAPEFPGEATWLNGQPLTWPALRGKVVILDFWAVSCGACYNDLPELSRLHENRAANGLTIIAIHASGNELDEIKKVVADHQLPYPICIDCPPASGSLVWGSFSAQFNIGAIPHFVVVDANGMVAASATNRFQEVLAVATKLANLGRPGPSPQP